MNIYSLKNIKKKHKPRKTAATKPKPVRIGQYHSGRVLLNRGYHPSNGTRQAIILGKLSLEPSMTGVLNLFLTADQSTLYYCTADHPGSVVELSSGRGRGGGLW